VRLHNHQHDPTSKTSSLSLVSGLRQILEVETYAPAVLSLSVTEKMREAEWNLREHPSPVSKQAYSEQTWELTLENWLRVHPDLFAALVVAAAFIVRIWTASGTFLNADEALHFRAANQPSWALTYQVGLGIAHPPLLIFLLRIWRLLGTSDLMLRFPSIILGTAFCWLVFKWLLTLFGHIVASIGVIFVAFLPPTIALSTEVRQYALLLFFTVSAAYLLERALADSSARKMLFSILCSYGAMFSHYSGVLVAAILAIYGLLRLRAQPFPRPVILTWIAGQTGSLGVGLLLYEVQLSKLGARFGGLQPLHAFMGPYYLHNSYLLGRNPVLFVIARSGAIFQYVFGQLIAGDLAFPMFLAGIVLLMRGKVGAAEVGVTPRLLGIFLLLPFMVNSAAGLAGAYPYGGTRHSSFLVMFAVAGVSLFLAKAVENRAGRGIALALLIVALCQAFPSHHKPYMARADQNSGHLKRALDYIEQTLPPEASVFTDQQTFLLLGHYLCHQKPYVADGSVRGFVFFQCGNHPVVCPAGDNWSFAGETFPLRWNDMIRAFHPVPGQTVLVVQAGWDINLARQLQDKFPEFRNLKVQYWGRNVSLFPLTVGRDGSMTIPL
jgi:hypothetical protein